MQKKEMYVAEDGQVFPTEEECLKHESRLRDVSLANEALDKLLPMFNGAYDKYARAGYSATIGYTVATILANKEQVLKALEPLPPKIEDYLDMDYFEESFLRYS